MHTDQVFIGGQWRAPASGETYATINPATEEESARVAKGDERDDEMARLESLNTGKTLFDSVRWRSPSRPTCSGTTRALRPRSTARR